jgi:hypothetical protein
LSRNAWPRDTGFWQRQDLKLATVKSDQAFGDQTVAGLDVIINGKLEQLADFIVAIKAQPIAIGRQHQKKVQQIFVVAERRQKAVEQEAPINPGKGWHQHPPALRQDKRFGEHDHLDSMKMDSWLIVLKLQRSYEAEMKHAIASLITVATLEKPATSPVAYHLRAETRGGIGLDFSRTSPVAYHVSRVAYQAKKIFHAACDKHGCRRRKHYFSRTSPVAYHVAGVAYQVKNFFMPLVISIAADG